MSSKSEGMSSDRKIIQLDDLATYFSIVMVISEWVSHTESILIRSSEDIMIHIESKGFWEFVAGWEKIECGLEFLYWYHPV